MNRKARPQISAAIILLLNLTLLAQNLAVQKSNTTENLRGISVLPNQIAWASGTHGTYLHTIDGGQTWQPAQVPAAEALDFRDVEAFSANLAYLLSAGPGDQSRIYKTTDAGKTWTLQFTNTNPKGFFDCMAFWDENRGIALGDPVADNAGNLKFELIATEDGGRNWKALDSPPSAIEGEGAFAASGTCITVQGDKNVWFATGGKAARVFHSTDAGKTWTVAETPITHGQDSTGIFSIAFRDALHGVIAGGDYKHPDQDGPNLAFTHDGGLTWKLFTGGAVTQKYFSAVAFAKPHSDSDGIVIVGSSGSRYEDGRAKPVQWDWNLSAVSVASTGEILAVGPKGLIVRVPSAH
jgi:photosystem II stability/assembly factor-like uncharacterized protein